ncbi:Membrane dipeptidase (Peptidase family M19) [Rosistilla oblonga]|uniref:dipeptidase n=1 Tax=Rosistilla oblonga TaxID=2527990 RepID=UPI00118A4995|nr:membrane dipeptidase [Rosistilla oblonga]QDV14149.1 Membrane dipeptidase (Peptidase family M19) [Rosistilla oblonga]
MRTMIDGHLDLAWNATSFDRDLRLSLDEIRTREQSMTDLKSRTRGTTCFPELQASKIQVCIATLLARSGPATDRQTGYARTDLDFAHHIGAYAAAHAQLACYQLWEQQGAIRWIRTLTDLEDHWSKCNGESEPPLGMILSMEGADPISDPDELPYWFGAGLRAIGLSHYGHGQYAAGTAVEGGLTEKGEQLLDAMAKLGMGLDVTHLADRAMEQAFDRFTGVLWASHHNSRTLVPGQRQLSDQQMKSVIEHDGVVGVAFDAWMMYPGWARGETDPNVVSIEAAADHIDYVCQMAGSTKHSAIGSDLDGGFGTEQTPGDLNSIVDMQQLDGILSRRGYSDDDLNAIFHGNWMRTFRKLFGGCAQ